MNTISILQNIDKVREDQHLEFKGAVWDLPKDLWETYSAFANADGGMIILGIHQDDKTKELSLRGVNDPGKLISDFWNIVRNPELVNRDIMLFDGVDHLNFEGRDYVIIDVPRADRSEKPVSVYDKTKKRFISYIRKGEGDYPATEDELRQMYYDCISGADRKALDNFGLDTLNSDTVKRYRNTFQEAKPNNPWNNDSDEDFCITSGQLQKVMIISFIPHKPAFWLSDMNMK